MPTRQERQHRLRRSLLLCPDDISKSIEVRTRCIDWVTLTLVSHMLTIGRKGSTLQLERHALTGRDLCTCLTHPLEGQRDLLPVTARYAVREDIRVIAVIEKVQGWTAARRHTTTEADIN